MKKVFLNTNIILDFLAERDSFYESIAKIATIADQNKVQLVATTISFTTVSYILSKYEPAKSMMAKMRKFAIICEVCEVNQQIVHKSLNSDFHDSRTRFNTTAPFNQIVLF